jgi:DNA (cytosine-5)-methyltransferase 1
MTEILEGFAGPGGFSEAARMLGLGSSVGVEVNGDACATATAAGHPRIQADIRTLNPDTYTGTVGAALGPPCPTFSDAGLQSGRSDYALVLAGSTMLGDSLNTVIGSPEEDAYTVTYERVEDERSALVLESLRFALRLPDVEWAVLEQVPAVERIWWDFAAELSLAGWESCTVLTLRADDFGAPTRRTRVFLLAARDHTPDLDGLPFRAGWETGRFTEPHTLAPNLVTPFPVTSMAAALGWPAGVRVNTRGERKTPGGNEFSADAPAIALTGKARSWYRTDLGKPDGYLHVSQAGLLQGFPVDYPWQGSRSSGFQQAADSVPPLMGAAVLGAAAGVAWQDAVWERLASLYGHTRGERERLRVCTTNRASAAGQLDLFGAAA